MKDYKNVASKVKISKGKPSGASKKKPAKKPRPGWLTLVYGLSVGLGVVLLLLNYMPSPDESSAALEKENPAQAKAILLMSDPGWAEVDETIKRYEFYETLRGAEVEIPESEIKERQAKIAPKENVGYLLQAGSFRSFREADSLKAQLALLGIESVVDPVVSNGVEWHRVRIGPFSSARDMNKVRNRVQRNKIETLVIKLSKVD